MQNYSVTLIGVLTVLLSNFISPEIAGELASDIVLVIGIIVAWYGRWRQGDITWYGMKK